MKKYLIIIGCVALVAFMVALFSGCSLQSNKENVSDIRYGIFDGECEEYNATFVYGIREKPYVLDGISNKGVEGNSLSKNFTENRVTAESMEETRKAGTLRSRLLDIGNDGRTARKPHVTRPSR